MTWIRDRIREREELRLRQRKISDSAPVLYSQLVKELEELVAEAVLGGFAIFHQGESGPNEIVIAMSVSVPPGQSSSNPAELHVGMDKEQEYICASGPNVSVRLTFDLIVDDSDDGEPTLLNDGGPITIADAARLILDPFLFPELPEFTPDYD
jgi:hypothetical protein